MIDGDIKVVFRSWYGSMLQRLGSHFLGNSASSVAARALSGGARLGVLLVLARVYGPESFGKVSLAISVVEILRTFSEFGIDTISIRRFAQASPEDRADLLHKILGARLVLAACFYFLGSIALFLIAGREVAFYSLIAGLSLFFAGVIGSLSSYLQSFFSMYRMFKTTVAGGIASVVFALCAIYFRAPVALVIVALPLADFVNLAFFCGRSDLPLRARFDVKSALSLLRESLPVGLMAIVVVIYFRLDNLFVFKFSGEMALGLYAACYRLVEPVLMVPHSFSVTAYTLLSTREHEKGGLREVMGVLWRTMWPAYALVAAIASAFVLGDKLLFLKLLPAYSAGEPILLILVATLVVRSINVALTAVFNSRARYSTVTKIAVANLAINLVLVVFLTPKYGAVGAAWAALATEFLNMLMQGRGVFSLLQVPGARFAVDNAKFEEM